MQHIVHLENGCFKVQHRCSADSKPSPYLVLLPSIFPVSQVVTLYPPPPPQMITEKFNCPLGVNVVKFSLQNCEVQGF